MASRLFLFALIVASNTACWSSPIEVVTRIDRGSLNCTEMVERRRVNNYWWELAANGKPFVPPGRDSNKVGACRISRNPSVQTFVFLLGDNIWRFQMKDNKPIATALSGPPGMDSIQQFKSAIHACDGKCLLWPQQLVFVDTGEVRSLSIPLDADLLGISPDLKTAVADGKNDFDAGTLSIRLIDTQTSRSTEKILPRESNMWLLDFREGREAIAEKFKWKNVNGKDQLFYP